MKPNRLSMDELLELNEVYPHFEKVIRHLTDYLEKGDFEKDFYFKDGETNVSFECWHTPIDFSDFEYINRYCIQVSCSNAKDPYVDLLNFYKTSFILHREKPLVRIKLDGHLENVSYRKFKVTKEINYLSKRFHSEFKRWHKRRENETLRNKMERDARKNGLRNTLK